MNQEQITSITLDEKNKYKLSEWPLFKQYDIWGVGVNCTKQKDHTPIIWHQWTHLKNFFKGVASLGSCFMTQLTSYFHFCQFLYLLYKQDLHLGAPSSRDVKCMTSYFTYWFIQDFYSTTPRSSCKCLRQSLPLFHRLKRLCEHRWTSIHFFTKTGQKSLSHFWIPLKQEWTEDFHYFLKEQIIACIMYAREWHSWLRCFRWKITVIFPCTATVCQ